MGCLECLSTGLIYEPALADRLARLEYLRWLCSHVMWSRHQLGLLSSPPHSCRLNQLPGLVVSGWSVGGILRRRNKKLQSILWSSLESHIISFLPYLLIKASHKASSNSRKQRNKLHLWMEGVAMSHCKGTWTLEWQCTLALFTSLKMKA